MADLVRIDHEIEGQSAPGDRGISLLAARQHGVVARRQLVAAGLGLGAIDHRLKVGRLHLIHRGVYVVGHPLPSGRGRWMAAVLACGPGALLSHVSAGVLRDLLPSLRSEIDVTADRSRRGRPGIALHQARQIHPDDRAVVDGIPVTSVARTLLDLAEVVSTSRLERAVEAAERLHLLDMTALDALFDRGRGRRGLQKLKALVDVRPDEPPLTRSELERRFLDLCRAGGLPHPRCNATVAGLEVDALWPHQGLVVELDGHAFHGTREAFERDRVRDAALQLAGFRVLRLTHRRLHTEPTEVIHTVQALLARW